MGVAQLVDPPNRRAVDANMSMFYVLKSLKDNKLYTGFSKNLKRRIEFHNEGLNEDDARRRERFLKSGRGREILKEQIKNSLI